ncbi:4'-phosphopantetheinyl transferase family protein [Cohnella herbarum]|uniref:4'-phosphopantetheinyl transferase superfamily protein n=1 Tax=Cohnella herbarum TaxID=2728023 RepID=A0A7Z2VEX4_9BACL|nr:4'-phosphopantetheinyl transferase superfamily protein [Cohnella herbarum]QJD81943.1 4'-phosphopantetheinyl transferase superfamily protein [Cohnella herbarum]
MKANRNEVGVYWIAIPPKAQTSLADRAVDWLDDEELHTYRSYRVDFKKMEFMTGRILMKTLLAERCSLPSPRRIRLRKNQYGKPLLDHARMKGEYPDNPGFNLSHTTLLVACAIVDSGEVGIDAEDIGRDNSCLMNRVFTEREIGYVESRGSAQEKREAFYEVWTRKEAYVKATGLGLSIPLRSFEVPFLECSGTQDGWKYFSDRLSEQYVISVAVRESAGVVWRRHLYEVDFNQLYESALTSAPFRLRQV